MTSRRPLIALLTVIALLLVTVIILLVQRSSNTSDTPIPPMMTKELSASELAKHAVATDCWTIITASVYNLTPFFDKTPNSELANKVCGRDGTEVLKPIAAAESKTLNEKFDIYRIGLLVP